MKYYKIVNPNGHRGIKYKEGYNEDPLPFNPSGDCKAGGIYFAKEDILAFLDYGTKLYEVEPIGQVYENPSKPKKYKAHAVNLKYIGEINRETIKLLIENGADINAGEQKLLYWIACNGDLKMFKYIVNLGFKIEDENVGYILYLTGIKNHIKLLKYILSVINKTNSDSDCSSVFTLLAKLGHLNIIKYFIRKNMKVDINEALKWAAYGGKLNVVKYLIKCGADISNNDYFALRGAAGKGHLNVVKFLMKKGAKITNGYNSALIRAIWNGHLDVVKYLIEQGANLDDFALKCARDSGHTEVVEYISKIKEAK